MKQPIEQSVDIITETYIPSNVAILTKNLMWSGKW